VFDRAEADFFARKPVPTFEKLKDLVSASPEVVRWISEKRLREAEVKLADALRVPDLTLGAGIRRREGSADETLVFGLSVPLQLFDRNQGSKAESRALLGWAEAEQRALEFRISALLLSLYEAAIHDLHLMEGLETEILPTAEEALELSREGFSLGRFSYLEVLDAQRTVFAVKQEYILAAASYHQFLVEIERLTGQPFDGGGLQR
jgi:cobalt-zinc-cadmium efflux system outer membrane protein